MKTSAKSKGKRYTEAERRKILNHVEHINKTRGRGGIASASRKFGVTALTVSNWLNSDEPLALSVRSASKRRGASPGASPDRGPTLRKLAALHEVIGRKKSEIAKLRKEFEKLKRLI